jgi:hypothetical protein
MTERYQSVNGAWPEGTRDGRDLKPTPQEAITAAKKLYRFAMKQPFRGKVNLTSGRRITWIRNHVLHVNPDERDGGWHEIVHSMSHYCARKLYRHAVGFKPHDHRHAFLERTMIEHVVNSGWLEGKLRRPENPKPESDVKTVRYQRTLSKIETWEKKAKRAENALKKLVATKRYYERTISV